MFSLGSIVLLLIKKKKKSYNIIPLVLVFPLLFSRKVLLDFMRPDKELIHSGTRFSKALFVPSISTYNKVTSGDSIIPSDLSVRDLSWQFNLQRIWEKIIHNKGKLLFGIFDLKSKYDILIGTAPRNCILKSSQYFVSLFL